jgi:hypothetical protein
VFNTALAIKRHCLQGARRLSAKHHLRPLPPIQERALGAVDLTLFWRSGRIAVGEDWIAILKCPGRIEAVVHRTTAGERKSITLTETPTGKYFAACLFEDGEDAPELPVVFPTEAVIGVDVGAPTSPSRAPAGRQTTPAMLPAPSETCAASRNPSLAVEQPG